MKTEATEARRRTGVMGVLLRQAALIGGGYLLKRLLLEPEFRRQARTVTTRALRALWSGIGTLRRSGAAAVAAATAAAVTSPPTNHACKQPEPEAWSPADQLAAQQGEL